MKTICYLREQVSAQNGNSKALFGNFRMLKIILLCLLCTSSGFSQTAPVTITVNPKPSAVISLSGSPMLCPGESLTLTADTADSYLWSDGATTQSITVSETGAYTVTVTSNGCSAVSEAVNVTVNNYPCGKDKLLICHIPPGNSGNPKTICINKNALPAHLAHGDYCGPCAEQAEKFKREFDWCGDNSSEISLNKYNTTTWSPCVLAASRDSFIPDDNTPFKYFYLLIVVVDSGQYGVTQENIDTMMVGVNMYFNPWKIDFCYSTEFIDSSLLYLYPKNKDSIFNVVIADWPTLGYSGNPIKIDYSVVINNNYKGVFTLAHELGHEFKLAHTFTYTEFPASDPYSGCTNNYRDRIDYSLSQQDTVGDRISDTPPTPRNSNCAPPTGLDSCSAGNPPWPSWGYNNIMGYSSCQFSSFTPQQAGRMHCYILNYPNLAIRYDCKLVYGDLHCNPSTSIIAGKTEISGEYLTVVPNPFKDNTTISFATMHDDVATLEIWSYTGQYISTIFNNSVIGGQKNQVEFRSDNLPAGVYFAKLKTSKQVLVKSLVIIK